MTESLCRNGSGRGTRPAVRSALYGAPGRGHTVRMSRLTAIVQRLGHQRWFGALGRRYVPLDRWLFRHTRGRWSVLSRSDLPSMLLTTTGRRSGEARTQPLLYAPDGDGYVVVG